MSIRMVAIELYRVVREMEELEKKLGSVPAVGPERDEVAAALREARALRDRLKKMIAGAKD
ncbi:MAG: hypothetical protein ACP5SH_18050 [Syntrophobacteraceae bacterium]